MDDKLKDGKVTNASLGQTVPNSRALLAIRPIARPVKCGDGSPSPHVTVQLTDIADISVGLWMKGLKPRGLWDSGSFFLGNLLEQIASFDEEHPD